MNTRKENQECDLILVERLHPYLEGVDPWDIGFDPTMIRMVPRPRKRPWDIDWGDDWTAHDHVRRIAFFLEDPTRITPIMLDNVCDYGFIYAEPVLVDGWHRWFATLHLGLKTVPASYSGRLDLLRYLTGKRKTRPR